MVTLQALNIFKENKRPAGVTIKGLHPRMPVALVQGAVKPWTASLARMFFPMKS
jgi:hypothetical protein